MLCLRCLRGSNASLPRLKPLSASLASRSIFRGITAQRTITTLLRPRILAPTASAPTTAATSLQPTAPLDILPKVSTHPSLAGIQVRNGPRDTYDPSHRVRKRRCGFLARKRSRTGRAILRRRLGKGRKSLTH